MRDPVLIHYPEKDGEKIVRLVLDEILANSPEVQQYVTSLWSPDGVRSHAPEFAPRPEDLPLIRLKQVETSGRPGSESTTEFTVLLGFELACQGTHWQDMEKLKHIFYSAFYPTVEERADAILALFPSNNLDVRNTVITTASAQNRKLGTDHYGQSCDCIVRIVYHELI